MLLELGVLPRLFAFVIHSVAMVGAAGGGINGSGGVGAGGEPFAPTLKPSSGVNVLACIYH